MKKIKNIAQYVLGWLWIPISFCMRVNRRQVLFFTFQGKYSCNPKYISECMYDLRPEIRIIWVVYETNSEFPDYVEKVMFGSNKYYSALYSSMVIIENAFNYARRPFKKKKGQIHIQTMHGSLGLKRIDPGSSKSSKRNKKGFRSAKNTDYIISNSNFENEVYRESFWSKTPIMKLGHARTDILMRNDSQIREKVRCFYGIDKDVKICLYAPTLLRSNHDNYDIIDYNSLRKSLETKFGGEWYILNRLHPTDARKSRILSDSSYVLNGNAYDDIQELMVAVDFGITDYSSWICDFVLTRKPGALFVPDYDAYSNTTGFYYSLSETPFIIAHTNSELIKGIHSFTDREYENKVDEFLTEKGSIDDGFSSRRNVDFIFKLIDD